MRLLPTSPGANASAASLWRGLDARLLDRLAAASALSVWAAMLAAALAAIAIWGRSIPLAEDWLLVAPVLGQEPDLLAWTLAQNNEHRAPLPRLLLLVLLSLTGGDFRVGMVTNALLLATAALVLMRAARRLRGGRLAWTDALFPVLFLHLGNWENILWSWQLAFTLSTLLACVALAAIVRSADELQPSQASAAALALALLPLSGANGLFWALGLAPWALVAGWRTARLGPTPKARFAGSALLTAAPLALAFVGLYFVGYQKAAWDAQSRSLLDTGWMSARLTALAFGPVARAAWWPFVGLSAVLIAPTLVLLARSAQRPEARVRMLGLLGFAGTQFALLLAIGWGRAGAEDLQGVPTRYVLLAAPLLALTYFVWQLHAPRGPRLAVQAGLAIILVALVLPNTRAGFDWRDWYVNGMRAVEADLDAGATPAALAAEHRAFLLHWNESLLRERLEQLRRARIGPFARLQPDPPAAPR